MLGKRHSNVGSERNNFRPYRSNSRKSEQGAWVAAVSADQYVESILAKYAVQVGSHSAAERAANVIAPAIRQWAGQWLIELRYSGSYAKGTAISIGTDVDLFISLSSTAPGTLAEIYEGLYNLASSQGWQPRRQNVSIGLTYGSVTLDLVPGKVQTGYQNYHSLYVSKRRSWTQTNVSLHVDTVTNSGRAREIRAIKIWRTLHSIDWPSIYLELFVIDVLKFKPRDHLASNVLTVLNAIADSLPTTRILDPANTNNVISDDLTSAEKSRISMQARASVNAPNWTNILW